MFKFARIRKKLWKFFGGFWVVIFIHLIRVNIVKGQDNLDSREVIPEDYREYYDIGATLREWLNNLADENFFLTWFIISVLIVIIIFIVFPKFQGLVKDIIEILSDEKTLWKNILYGFLFLMIIVSLGYTFYLRMPHLTLTPQNTTGEYPTLYLSSKVDLKLEHDRQDKSNLKYAVCYSKSDQGSFWRDINQLGKSWNKDNDCLPAFIKDNRFIYQGNLNDIYYWKFKAFEDDNEYDKECEITNLKKCKGFGNWSKPIKIAQYRDSLMRIRKTGKVLVGLSTSYNQGIYSLKIEKNGKLERDGVDIKVSKKIVEQIKQEILENILKEMQQTSIRDYLPDFRKVRNLEIEYVEVNWGELLDLPRTGKADFIISSISKYEKRQKEYKMISSNPYHTVPSVLVYKQKTEGKEEGETIETIEDMLDNNHYIGVQEKIRITYILEQELDNLEQEFDNLKQEFDNLKQEFDDLEGKVNNQDKNSEDKKLATLKKFHEFEKNLDEKWKNRNNSSNQKKDIKLGKKVIETIIKKYSDPLELFQALIDGQVKYVIMDQPFAKYAVEDIFCQLTKNDDQYKYEYGEKSGEENPSNSTKKENSSNLTKLELFKDQNIFEKDQVMEEYIVAVRQQDQRLLNIINKTINKIDINNLIDQAEKEAKNVKLTASGERDYSCQ